MTDRQACAISLNARRRWRPVDDCGVVPRAESITFVPDFGFNGRHAYDCVALERGYCKQVGLDVSFVRGSGSVDAIRKVGAGAAQIGFADAGSLNWSWRRGRGRRCGRCASCGVRVAGATSVRILARTRRPLQQVSQA
jgi:ABC-type nitrate/sulfonate/bicarbonate transport system substrate-binding protein